MEAQSEALFLAQIVLLLLVGRLIGEAMQRIGQPAVMGQLIAGILLGPSVFGALWPDAQRAIFAAGPQQKGMIDAISQLGVLMLLLLTGMETDLRLVKQARRAALSTSIAGIVVPFACGFALGELLPAVMLPKPDQRLITSLFLGTALSIASVNIVTVVVREMGFMRRNVGIAMIASAIIDDTVGWVIVAIVLGLAAHGRVDALALGQSIIGTAIFLAVSFTLGRRLVFSIYSLDKRQFYQRSACGDCHPHHHGDDGTRNLFDWRLCRAGCVRRRDSRGRVADPDPPH
jgi:Kef-type K+ transport system membrane component KefB